MEGQDLKPLDPSQLLWPDPEVGPFRLVLAWHERQGRALCTGVSLQSTGSDEVTATLLRKVRLDAIVREARADRWGSSVGRTETPPPQTKRGGRRALTHEFLGEVAAIYRAAGETNGPPRLSVAWHYGVPTATASRWISMARQAGHLPATTKGRASHAPSVADHPTKGQESKR